MGKTYSSTIQLRCFKDHACAACGNTYQYLMTRKVVGNSGRSAEHASQKCRQAVDRTMRDEVDEQPCPTCGLVQPDMVGQRRRRSHKLTLILMTILALAVLILRGAYVLNNISATWILTAVTALAAMGYAATEGTNPNKDLAANRERAAAAVAAGTVRTIGEQRPAARQPGGGDLAGRAGSWWLFVLFAALAPLVAAVPEVVRHAQAWPANDAFYPPVVGPGDTARVYMPEKISSVKGYYRGSSSANFEVPSAEPAPLTTTMNQNNWGKTINVKSSEKSSSSRPWVEVTVPQTDALAGQKGDCAVHLTVEYPAISAGGSSFEVESQEFDHHFPLVLAPAGAGTKYGSIWWSAGAASVGVLFVAGLLLRWAAKRLQARRSMTNVAFAT